MSDLDDEINDLRSEIDDLEDCLENAESKVSIGLAYVLDAILVLTNILLKAQSNPPYHLPRELHNSLEDLRDILSKAYTRLRL